MGKRASVIALRTEEKRKRKKEYGIVDDVHISRRNEERADSFSFCLLDEEWRGERNRSTTGECDEN